MANPPSFIEYVQVWYADFKGVVIAQLKNGNELFRWERNEKSVGDFERWYPSKAPSMTFEDPGRMNA